ncbi:hypothetical protein [Kribbella sp. NBC_00889]|uniref:hypothetical protein n=1 Tax=Kribbella sp. NBC_00889 TaxID=2975974 RepID=UPI00386D47A1|nr:hypothetical protein OG817_13405 [Kribbella sp. NBC_00889]
MSEQSPKPSGTVAASPPRQATTGSKLWFVWMVGMWIIFFVLLRSDRLDALASSIRDLPIVAELVVWFLCFPWVLGTAVWTSGWSEWLRVLLVVLFAAGWTIISIPRAKQPKQ